MSRTGHLPGSARVSQPTHLPPPLLDVYGWQDLAACAHLDVNVFFEFDGVRGRRLAMREERAKRVCRSCPVVEKCLAHALVSEPYGVWGGLTARERVGLRARRDAVAS